MFHSFEYIGLAATALTWLSGGYLLTRWQDKDLQTVSRHAASNAKALWLFAFTLIGLGVAMYGWIIFWLAPELGLDRPFVVVSVLAFVCQCATAALPDWPGWLRTSHRLVAWLMAGLFFPMAILLALSEQLSPLAQVVCGGLAIYMALGICLVIMRKVKSNFLFWQTSYVVALQLSLLAAAYL